MKRKRERAYTLRDFLATVSATEKSLVHRLRNSSVCMFLFLDS